MPRKARIDAPGALHHIIVRGIERRKIFKDDTDRYDFLDRLGHVLTQTATRCFAWALIPNHFHLLLRTGRCPISTVMRRLLTGHAMGFNRRHRRSGRLFQNRYKSILCQEDAFELNWWNNWARTPNDLLVMYVQTPEGSWARDSNLQGAPQVVTMENPMPGTWNVEVFGLAIQSDLQDDDSNWFLSVYDQGGNPLPGGGQGGLSGSLISPVFSIPQGNPANWFKHPYSAR